MAVYTEFKDSELVWLAGWHVQGHEDEDSGLEPPKVACRVKGKPSKDGMVVAPLWGDLCPECSSLPHRAQPPEIIVNPSTPYTVLPMDRSNMEGRQNMVDLADLQVGELMHNLRLRYQASPMQYYTYVGEILIAVNPLKNMGRIGLEQMKTYQGKSLGTTELPPHIYAIGDEAYRRLREQGGNQSIVISGESGAGKSEGTKHVLEYLAFCAEKGEREVDVNSRILATSEVLEAFGNAKTPRNDNSSRFGKFVQVQYNRNHVIIGARIEQYLLEKSRIVQQELHERNYHIFYIMLKYLPKAKLTALRLTKVEDYRYLVGPNRGNVGSYSIKKNGEDMGDEQRWKDFVRCLETLAFPPEFVDSMWRTMAAVLLLGQIQFDPPGSDREGMVTIRNAAVVEQSAELLGVDATKLAESFRFTHVMASAKYFSLRQAQDNVDAVAKQIYGRFFEILVEKINTIIAQDTCDQWIGVLDIFGFECFQEKLPDGSVNSQNKFSQLCINLTNEQLQHFFFETLIPKQEKKYKAEGIDIAGVKYPSNSGCVELLSSRKMSVLTLLNSTTTMAATNKEMQEHPDVANRKWLGELKEHFGKSPGPKKRAEWKEHAHDFFGWHVKPDVKHQKHDTDFFIHHYAGQVWYTTEDAVDRNKDAIAHDCGLCLQSSSDPLVAHIVPTTDDAAKGKAKTVAAKFTDSLDALRHNLESTEPLFVRCVKPNCVMKSGGFLEDWKVLDQLNSAGMYAVVEMRVAGYPVERAMPEFAAYFEVLMDDREAYRRMSPVDQVKAVCKKVEATLPPAVVAGMTMAPWRVGHTKVFFKDSMWKFLVASRDDALRKIEQRKKIIIPHVKAIYKMYQAIQKMPALRLAADLNAVRLAKKRHFIEQGMSPKQAEDAIAAEVAAAAAAEEQAFRNERFGPVKARGDGLLAAVEGAIKAIADFLAAPGDADGPSLNTRSTNLKTVHRVTSKAIAAFDGNVHDPQLEQAAVDQLGNAEKALRDEAASMAIDVDRRVRADEIREQERQAERARRREEKRRVKLAEAEAAAAIRRKEVEDELRLKEESKLRKKEVMRVERLRLIEEHHRMQEEEQAFQLRLEMERLKAVAAQQALADKVRKKELRRNAILHARTNALKGLPVKFQQHLCTVAYVGHLPFPGSGEFVGLVCPQPMGDVGTNGFCMGAQLFECPPYHGIFVRGEMLHIVNPTHHDFQVGDAVWRMFTPHNGVVRYVGPTSFDDGMWVGVELTEEGAGKNDGSVQDVRYFDCPPQSGVFVRPETLALVVPWTEEFVTEVTEEYCQLHGIGSLHDDDDSIDGDEIRLKEELERLQNTAIVVTDADLGDDV